MLIFDRESAKHPWRKALSELGASKDTTHQAVAENWQMDHRVSKAREQVLRSSGEWDGAGSGALWLRGVAQYSKRHLCRPWVGHPTADSSNATNLLGGSRVPGFDQLIHVTSLNRLLNRLARSADAGFEAQFEALVQMPFAERRPGDPTSGFLPGPCQPVDEVADSLRGQGPDTIRSFAGLLIDRLGETQPPWWAGFAEEVSDAVLGEDGANLCRLLGLGHLYEGEWLIAWVYDARHVGPFYRPTVVEAATTPFHFPSPPEHPWGVTMPLGEDLPAYREVVHPVIDGDLARIACTGRLYHVSENPEGYNGLEHHRRSQQGRLRREYPHTAAQEWLERHFGGGSKP